MTRLSVNINKVATLRNARGGKIPDLLIFAQKSEQFGAQGITVHPRQDERHIKKEDVYNLKPIITTEFNIEGYPSEEFMSLVLDIKPNQVTLVPDSPNVITSNAGWNTIKKQKFLKKIIQQLKKENIRTSIFIETNLDMISAAKDTGTDRIELYTEEYAKKFNTDKREAVMPFVLAAKRALALKLEVNAGHDLNLDNLKYFLDSVPEIKEVSIGHALISDTMYFGLENTIQMYLRQLKK